MVVPVMDYVPALLGEHFSMSQGGKIVRIERDSNTGTRFLRTESNLDKIKDLHSSVMRHYSERAMMANRKKVIAYAVAYAARDSNGRLCKSGQPSFSDLDGHVIGFTYEVRYLANDRLYRRVNTGNWCGSKPDGDEDDELNNALEICINDRELSAQNVIDWSQEAEEACRQFELAISGIGQRLFDYFQQPADALKLALESRSNPMLPPPSQE